MERGDRQDREPGEGNLKTRAEAQKDRMGAVYERIRPQDSRKERHTGEGENRSHARITSSLARAKEENQPGAERAHPGVEMREAESVSVEDEQRWHDAEQRGAGTEDQTPRRPRAHEAHVDEKERGADGSRLRCESGSVIRE